MNLKSVLMVFPILFSFLSPTKSLCQTIGKAQVEADKRLTKKVTVSEKSITLGELLENLEKQTGVALPFDPRFPAYSFPLAVQFEDEPLSEILDGLYGLFSASDSMWKWEALKESGLSKYYFKPSDAFNTRKTRFDAYSQLELEKYVKKLIALSTLPPRDREARKIEIKEALHSKKDEQLQPFTQDELVWDEFRFFAQALSPVQIDKVLHEGGDVDLEVDRLSAEAKKSFTLIYGRLIKQVKLEEGSVSPPPPTTIGFRVVRPLTDWALHAPEILARLGRAGTKVWMKTDTLNLNLRDDVWKKWLLTGDSMTSRFQYKTVPAAPIVPKGSPNIKYLFLDRGKNKIPESMLQSRLIELAKGIGIPMLAFANYKNNFPSETPGKNRVEDYLNRLTANDPKALFKWRGDVLIVTNCDTFIQNINANISYDTMKKWRRDKDGVASLSDFSTFMNNLNSAQALNLAAQFPEKKTLIDLYPIITYAKEHPEILTPKGMKLDEESYSDLNNYSDFASIDELANQKIVALRLREVETKTATGRTLSIFVEGLEEDGKTILMHAVVQEVKNAQSKS